MGRSRLRRSLGWARYRRQRPRPGCGSPQGPSIDPALSSDRDRRQRIARYGVQVVIAGINELVKRRVQRRWRATARIAHPLGGIAHRIGGEEALAIRSQLHRATDLRR